MMKKTTKRILRGLCAFGMVIPLSLNVCAPMTTHAHADSSNISPEVQQMISRLLQQPDVNSSSNSSASNSNNASSVVSFGDDNSWDWQQPAQHKSHKKSHRKSHKKRRRTSYVKTIYVNQLSGSTKTAKKSHRKAIHRNKVSHKKSRIPTYYVNQIGNHTSSSKKPVKKSHYRRHRKSHVKTIYVNQLGNQTTTKKSYRRPARRKKVAHKKSHVKTIYVNQLGGNTKAKSRNAVSKKSRKLHRKSHIKTFYVNQLSNHTTTVKKAHRKPARRKRITHKKSHIPTYYVNQIGNHTSTSKKPIKKAVKKSHYRKHRKSHVKTIYVNQLGNHTTTVKKAHRKPARRKRITHKKSRIPTYYVNQLGNNSNSPVPKPSPKTRPHARVVVNHKTVPKHKISTNPVAPSVYNDGYHNGHWYQNGHRLYYYYPWAGTDISNYKEVKNSGRPNRVSPKFHRISGIYSYYYGRSSQALGITPDGHYAFITLNSHRSGLCRVLRINLSNGWVKCGPWFYGGHGQASAYNPKTNRIWLLAKTSNDAGDSNAGAIDQGYNVEVNPNTLRPMYRHWFDMSGEYLGDNLAFNNNGDALNAEKVYNANKEHKQFSTLSNVFYKGELSEHGAEWQRLEGILHSGGVVCQGIAYNPLNGRVYEQSSEGHNSIISVKQSKLNNNDAKPSDIHQVRMRNQREEPEGITFDKKGYCYMLVTNDNTGFTSVMKSNYPLGKNS